MSDQTPATPGPYESPKYFPFYHRDFMAGVRAVSATARGGYISLLCYQWDLKKGVPGDDVTALGLIMGTRTTVEAKKAWAELSGKFVKHADGGWWNAKLEKVRVEVESYFAIQKAKGAKGGRPPKAREHTPEPTPGKPRGLAGAKPEVNHGPSHTNNKQERSTGSGTQPRSEISPPSADLSQPDHSVISSPSDAHARTGGNGWEIWLKAKAYVDGPAERGAVTKAHFAQVYAAVLNHGRLELYVEEPGIAHWFSQHHAALMSEALAAAGRPNQTWRLIAKRRAVARAS